MINPLNKLLTNNLTEVPLYYVNLDYRKYKEYGLLNSCQTHYNPIFKDDEQLKQLINKTVDYIRENYDMKDII